MTTDTRAPSMSKLLHVFAPVGKAVRAFFKADLRLRREDGALHLVLEDQPRPAERKARATPAAALEKERRQLEAMLTDLAALLDESPGNRQALRHLALVEHALHKKGLRVLDKMPLDVLKRAHAQLEGLVTNWSQEGLACLRSKMAVAVIEREVPPPAAAAASVVRESRIDDDLDAPLAHPQALDEEAAREAESALLAAYGSMMLGPAEPGAEAPGPVELQGELNSPSARALAKAAKAAAHASAAPAEIRLRELQS